MINLAACCTPHAVLREQAETTSLHNALEDRGRTTPWLSVAIPARNDAAALTRTLDYLQGLPEIGGAEIIVAAAGDPDGTACAVAGRARLLLPSGSTRAHLMNAGAAVATGQTLFFLKDTDKEWPTKSSRLTRSGESSSLKISIMWPGRKEQKHPSRVNTGTCMRKGSTSASVVGVNYSVQTPSSTPARGGRASGLRWRTTP